MTEETYIPVVDEEENSFSYYNTCDSFSMQYPKYTSIILTKRLDTIVTKGESKQRSKALGKGNQGKKNKVNRKDFDEIQKLAKKEMSA